MLLQAGARTDVKTPGNEDLLEVAQTYATICLDDTLKKCWKNIVKALKKANGQWDCIIQ